MNPQGLTPGRRAGRNGAAAAIAGKALPIRRRVRVRGQVQGVGFRPFVHNLAVELGLAGWVLNDAAGVDLEVQGDPEIVETFLHRLNAEPPPLARVDAVEIARVAVEAIDPAHPFRIAPSRAGAVRTGITPDAAVCPACLAELFDPADRRYRYPFINCTHCGPRYTLTHALPYDRPNTSMAAFRQCPPCQREYDDPADRRFHAQPNACPDCGPSLALLQPDGSSIPATDPIAETVRRLRAGEILAVKGLGGFHLLCDARNAASVARLRARKHREEKPLAVMAANLHALEGLVEIGAPENALLRSRDRPIVLLRKGRGCDDALPGVAPGLAWLGAMLAYTPLHYLLFHEAAGRPPGVAWLEAEDTDRWLLVCTSANPGGEPLVIDNGEAVRRLSGIADALLVHDRDIRVRCDDSVVRVGAGGAAFLRRARGYTPNAIRLPRSGPSVLALGAWLKNTLCVTRGDQAFLSQHIGDLDNAATCRSLHETARHLLDILEIRPERVACDRHPDFYSSQLAAAMADELRVPLIRVQHHHAHLAAVQAEHGLDEPVLGIAMDGVGLGDDGTPWGGELLRVEGASFERRGHLAPLALPGGDRAAREPWRMAAAALHALGRGAEIPARFPDQPFAAQLAELLERGTASPRTTSLGRHFDAAAGLLGIRPVQRFEGQAAMLLEGLAERHGAADPLPQGWRIESGHTLDLRPLLAWLADFALEAGGRLPRSATGNAAGISADSPHAAAVFHATLAAALADWIQPIAETTGIRGLAFSGGCVLNQVLMTDLERRLAMAGFRVYLPRLAPANDGGLSLGQAWVAMNAEVRPGR
ncbi:carbamoyltransferase HypF [Thioalkalivibrio paradoxus]|uniref:Carbamoyltransferase HypF n=1 Tax=Thioalkalivibrio paradoxus ARh 1 TaxID=713585 RepID=W0DL71_9GAMM|nr:carbamoyltransferase HypF [Thioalkalivibrio paradoxus]AHE98012.1 carbamoyltransferase [Thioalkalivibrio paradoxus ARh 1]